MSIVGNVDPATALQLRFKILFGYVRLLYIVVFHHKLNRSEPWRWNRELRSLARRPSANGDIPRMDGDLNRGYLLSAS
jgi:hypothetical protein